MALAVPADHTAASAGMVAALAVRPGYTVPVADMADMADMAAAPADHTVASAGMVAALAVRPGYTVPVADMAAAPAGRTVASAGTMPASAGRTAAYADTVPALAVRSDYMTPESTEYLVHSVPDFAQPSQLFPAPDSAQKSIRHQLRQYLLLYSVHPCCHLPPM